MPIMIVGADAKGGEAIVSALNIDDREVRAFVTDLGRALDLREAGLKVAQGDVSDDGHIEVACTNCFSVVLLAEAAKDDRERAFTDDPETVLEGWSRAVTQAGADRAIWVMDGDPPATPGVTSLTVSPHQSDVEREVARLDDLAEL